MPDPINVVVDISHDGNLNRPLAKAGWQYSDGIPGPQPHSVNGTEDQLRMLRQDTSQRNRTSLLNL
jgi:hypothetical protein